MNIYKKTLLVLMMALICGLAPLRVLAVNPGGGGTTPPAGTGTTTTTNTTTTNDSSTKNAIQCGINSAASGDCTKDPSGSLDTTVKVVVNILSALVGVAAVIMIIVGGFRYVTSGGNQESTKSARNTILYSVVGLVIVALAQIIVHFVLHQVS